MMNERIKELALKAGFKKYDGTSLYSPYIEGMELNDELQEFAELIIAKCVEIADDYSDSGIIPTKINKYFGVE